MGYLILSLKAEKIPSRMLTEKNGTVHYGHEFTETVILST